MAEVRSRSKNTISIPFSLIFAALVSLLCYSVFGYLILVKFSSFVLFLFFVYYLFEIYKDHKATKESTKVTKTELKFSIRDFLSLLKRYYRINRKYSFMTLVGLILAIIVISQVFIISATYQQAAYSDFIRNKDTAAIRLSVEEMDKTVFDEWVNVVDQNIQTWLGGELSIGDYYLEGNVKFKLLLGHAYNQNRTSSDAHFIELITHEWNSYNHDLLMKLPSFNEFSFNKSESILVLPPSIDFLTANVWYNHSIDDFNLENDQHQFSVLLQKEILYRQLDPNNFSDFFNTSHPVDTVYQLSHEDVSIILQNKIEFPIGFEDGGFYLSKDAIWTFLDELYEKAGSFSQNLYVWGELGYSMLSWVNVPNINTISISRIREILDLFVGNVLLAHNSFISNQISYTSSVPSGSKVFAYSPLFEVLIDFQDGLKELQDTILIFIGPLFLLSLFLLLYSLNLVEKRKTKINSLFLSKGMSDIQIKSIILGEILITSSIGIIIGMLLSIIASENILFSGNVITTGHDFSLIIPFDWWYRIPLLGFSIIILFNLSNLYSLTKYPIDESINVEEAKQPIWEKWNIDLLLFIVCSLFWIVIFVIPLEVNQAESLYKSYGVPILILSIISFPWVLARNFLDVVEKIIFNSKLRYELLILALRNLRRNKNLTSRLISLVMIGFILLAMGISVSKTAIDVNSERALYELGSDIVIENIDFNTPISTILQEIPNVEYSSNVHYVKYQPRYQDIPKGVETNTLPNLHFLGIDPDSFSKAAYWKNNYADDSLNNMVQKLKNTPNASLMHSKYSKLLNLDIGSNYNFSYGKFGKVSFELQLTSTFDYFPRLVSEEALVDNSDVLSIISDNFIVITLETLDYLLKTNLNRMVELSMTYVKVNSDSDLRKIQEEIYSKTKNIGVELSNIKDYKSIQSSLFPHNEDKNPLIQYETDFLDISRVMSIIYIFIICVVSTSFYSFIFSVERRKELGIYRALGMKNSQIFTLLLLELGVIIFAGALLGIGAGYFLSYLTFLILFSRTLNPVLPYSLSFLWPLILAITVAIIIISIIISLVSIRRISHSQTGNILREL